MEVRKRKIFGLELKDNEVKIGSNFWNIEGKLRIFNNNLIVVLNLNGENRRNYCEFIFIEIIVEKFWKLGKRGDFRYNVFFKYGVS